MVQERQPLADDLDVEASIDYVRQHIGGEYATTLETLDFQWQLQDVYIEETDDGYRIQAETRKAIIDVLTPGDDGDREMGEYPYQLKDDTQTATGMTGGI